jgi:hydrogenase maturation protease
MMMKETTKIEPLLIIGIGTEFSGDGAAGLAVARSLHSIELPRFVKVIEFSGDGVSLINAWDENTRVILIERVLTQTSPGTIVAIDLLYGSFRITGDQQRTISNLRRLLNLLASWAVSLPR